MFVCIIQVISLIFLILFPSSDFFCIFISILSQFPLSVGLFSYAMSKKDAEFSHDGLSLFFIFFTLHSCEVLLSVAL